jgi:hypothetical protein
MWRFGHHGQCALPARAAIGEIWVEKAKRFHPLVREFFTQQADDLNLSYR